MVPRPVSRFSLFASACVLGACLLLPAAGGAAEDARAEEQGGKSGEAARPSEDCNLPDCGGITREGPLNDGVVHSDPYRDIREQLDRMREQLEDAETPAERAAIRRRLADALLYASRMEVETGNWEQAIADIEGAIETGALSPREEAEQRYSLGRLYLGAEPPDYEKAIENLRHYIDFFEKPEAEAYFDHGRALASQGNHAEAVPRVKKAIDLSERPNENHYRLLLLCYRKLGQKEEEIALLERMTQLFPSNDEYADLLAAARRRQGKTDE